MMFEMPENIKILDDAGIQKLQDKLDVNISIKPKQRQANKSVLIKAQVRLLGISKVEWAHLIYDISLQEREDQLVIHLYLFKIGKKCFKYIQSTAYFARP